MWEAKKIEPFSRKTIKNPLQRVENARSQDLALRNFEQNMSGTTVMY